MMGMMGMTFIKIEISSENELVIRITALFCLIRLLYSQ